MEPEYRKGMVRGRERYERAITAHRAGTAGSPDHILHGELQIMSGSGDRLYQQGFIKGWMKARSEAIMAAERLAAVRAKQEHA